MPVYACLGMYTYVYVCGVCMYMDAYVCTCMHMYSCVCICMYVYTCIMHMHVCKFVYAYCAYMRIYTYVRVCMHAYMPYDVLGVWGRD